MKKTRFSSVFKVVLSIALVLSIGPGFMWATDNLPDAAEQRMQESAQAEGELGLSEDLALLAQNAEDIVAEEADVAVEDTAENVAVPITAETVVEGDAAGEAVDVVQDAKDDVSANPGEAAIEEQFAGQAAAADGESAGDTPAASVAASTMTANEVDAGDAAVDDNQIAADASSVQEGDRAESFSSADASIADSGVVGSGAAADADGVGAKASVEDHPEAAKESSQVEPGKTGKKSMSAMAEDAEAKIGDMEYATLQEAIDAAAESGDTITILRDITVTERIAIRAKSLVVDFDGHKLSGEGFTANSNAIWIAGTTGNSADVTIKNATISDFDCNYAIIEMTCAIDQYMRTTLKDCVIENNTVASNEEALFQLYGYNQKSGTQYFVFDGCTITNNTAKSGYIIEVSGNSRTYTQLILSNTLVENNTVLYSTIATHNNTYLKMEGSVVKNNVAKGSLSYDNTSGGVKLYGYKCTMANSAIYNNTLELTSKNAAGTANDMWVWRNKSSYRDLSGMLAANEMVDPFDPSFDFSNMVWKDGKKTGYEDALPKNVTADCYYTVMDKAVLEVAQINGDPDKIYESLEDAFSAAAAGDTIELVAKEPVVTVRAGIQVPASVTFDAKGHDIEYEPATEGSSLFTVESGATLTMQNTQPDGATSLAGGVKSGDVLVEDGGKAVVADAMAVDSFTNNGELELNVLMKAAKVKLGTGKLVKLGDAYANATKSDTKINISLDDAVLAALNDGTSATVRVVDGGNEALLDSIVVAGITNGSVVKEFKNGGVELHIIKAVYLSGSGNDTNSGATASSPVKTFAKAKELLAADPELEVIVICGEVPVAGSETWSLPEGKSILRDAAYSGALVRVADGGILTLKDITLDGRKIDARDALVRVDKDGTLSIQDGAVLKNNNNSRQDFYRFGGGVCSKGTINMTGGLIDNCYAGYGGGVFQEGGAFAMTGGTISNNRADVVYVSSADDARPGAGGGVMLVAGAKMTFGSEDGSAQPVIANNSSRGEGGGIALGSNTHGGKGWFIKYVNGQPVNLGTSLKMHSGSIDGNSAGTTGGGIFVQDSMSAYVYGGAITNNTARAANAYFGGGGIYVNGLHTIDNGKYMSGSDSYLDAEEKDLEHGFLYLESIEICNNTAAWLGGALAACNVSKTIVGDFSTAIHDNSIENTGGIVTTSADNIDVFLSTLGHSPANVVSIHPLAYLSNYMIGGGEYGWLNGAGRAYSTDNLYANERALAAYTPVASDSADMQAAIAGAKVLISGNYSGSNGGGLGSNGIIVIGKIVDKVDVSVKKAWDESIDMAHPTKLRFVLYRQAPGEDKEQLAAAEVAAGDDGAYAYTWKDLLKHVPNTDAEYVYTVEEDLDYEAVDAEGNAIDLAKWYKSTAKSEADAAREIMRPQPDGTVKTYDQVVKNFTLTNTLKTGELEVSKTLTGEGADTAKEFIFTVSLDTTALDSIKLNGVFGDMAFADNVATFALKGGEAKKAAGLPAGVTYTVEEDDYAVEGYATTSTGAVGSIEADTVAKAAFTNDRPKDKPAPASGSIQAQKKLTGNLPAELPTFTFKLVPLDSAPAPAQAMVSVQGEGAVDFGQIDFEEPGTYAYTVSEQCPDPLPENWTYDTSVYTVTFAVEEVGGALVVTRSIAKDGEAAETIVFTNSYYKPVHDVEVVLVKYLEDALIHAEEFSFGLYDVDGTLLDTVHTTLGTHVNAEKGHTSSVQIAFKNLVFAQPGTYTYRVREHLDDATEVVEGDENNLKGFEPGFYYGGVRYDDKFYEVVITVIEAEDGSLVATVSYPDAADGVHLHNFYSEEYVEIDGNDSHPNDGLHQEQPKKEPEPKQDEPVQDEQEIAPARQPESPATTPAVKPVAPKLVPKAVTAVTPKGGVKTGDAAPVAPIAAAALVAAGALALAWRRRREQ